MNWDQVIPNLQAPLDASAVKPPPQGKYGEYVEGTHCIREANRIFGYGGWTYDTAELRCTTDRETPESKYFVGYLAIVRVVVDGVARCDVGHGSGVSKNHADAHDSACKEAVTDGLKRALRTFGNTFGLALYEKDKAKREVADLSRVDAAVAHIDATFSGKDLLDVVIAFDDVSAVPEVIDARVSKLRDIIRGAPSEAVLNVISAKFGPDAETIAQDIADRKAELQEAA